MCESGPSIPLTHVQIAGPQLYPPPAGSLSRSVSETTQHVITLVRGHAREAFGRPACEWVRSAERDLDL